MISYVRRRICLLTVLVLLSSLLAAFPTASYAVGAYPSAPFAIPTNGSYIRGFIAGSHYGIDISGAAKKERGPAVYAAYPGTVIYVGRDVYIDAAGNSVPAHMVVIDHGLVNGKYTTTIYAHMGINAADNGGQAKTYIAPCITVGVQVKMGTYLGDQGSAGNATGTHLHFQIHQRTTPYSSRDYWSPQGTTAVNPAAYIVGSTIPARFTYNGPAPTGCTEPNATDTTPPSVTFSSPQANATAGRYVHLQGSASDDKSGLKLAHFTGYWNNQWRVISEDYTTSPMALDVDLCALNVPDGPIEFGFDAYDKAGLANKSPNGTIKVRKQYSCAPVCQLKARGDANCDGSIDLLDFELFRTDFIRTRWGNDPYWGSSDFNVDGRVDLLDFEIFRSGYLNGKGQSSPTVDAPADQSAVVSAVPIIASLNRTTFRAAQDGTVELDVLLKNEQNQKISGATVAVRYPSDYVDFLPVPSGYASDACRAQSWLGSATKIDDNPYDGLVKVSTPTLQDDGNLPSGSVCAATLRFKLKETSIQPYTLRIQLAANPASWQVVGPGATFATLLDTARSAATIFTGPVPNAMYRFRNTGSPHHFFTASASEAEYVKQTYPNTWSYEGIAFYVFVPPSCAGQAPVYRFSGPAGHFYTISEAEKNFIVANMPAWHLDGPAYCAYTTQAPGTLPVYRFKSSTLRSYFYTISEDEKNYIVAHVPAWTLEGVSFYVIAAPPA